MPKTGTTSIQNFLKTNQQQLFNSHNLYYSIVNKKLKTNRNVDFLRGKIRKKLIALKNNAMNKNIILSNEDLSITKSKKVNLFLKNISLIFANYEIRIIRFIREPVDFINSLYCQKIKHGVYKNTIVNYREFITTNLANFDIAKNNKIFLKLINNPKIINIKYKEGNSISSLFSYLNIDIKNMQKVRNKNTYTPRKRQVKAYKFFSFPLKRKSFLSKLRTKLIEKLVIGSDKFNMFEEEKSLKNIDLSALLI